MKIILLFLMLMVVKMSVAQTADTDSVDWEEQNLDEVEVRSRKVSLTRLSGAQNGFELNKDELFRAACCNLGEAFQNNPSVDVNYSDAATGAKQIRLLGLAGTYVQMLTETQPNFFGGAKPFALGYVPGPWMKSISVSKGTSTVKNGFEGITGQINVQYLQSEDEEGINVNLYGDSDAKVEANADANIHLNTRLSTEILLHYDDVLKMHDPNGDTFLDRPDTRQYNAQNRWAYLGSKYIGHYGISALKEDRLFGQRGHHAEHIENPWLGKVDTERYEVYMKHAFVLDKEHGSNIALMMNGAIHNQDATYGERYYNIEEKDFSSQLMFETNLSKMHSLSVGASYEFHNYYWDRLFNKYFEPLSNRWGNSIHSYFTSGLYGQYTLNLNDRLVAMFGIRGDMTSHANNEKGFIVTPRAHLKYQLTDWMQIRLSAGKGYRMSNLFWAENTHLLAMSRNVDDSTLGREEAWNFGGTLGFDIPLWNRNLKVNAEYFYTNFVNKAIVDYDSDEYSLLVYNGKGYSHVLQIDATYEPLEGLTATLAFRRNIVRDNYWLGTMDEVLVSKYKGLLTLSYKPGLGLWQFDGSVQLNGPCRLPVAWIKLCDIGGAGNNPMPQCDYSPVYPQINLQVTRWFRHFSVYAGVENLTNFKQQWPVIGADNPWNTGFDATQVWGPVMGRMIYAGVRINM